MVDRSGILVRKSPWEMYTHMRNRLIHNQKILIKLSLSPQMRQSIKLLGMATKDIVEFVETAVESNPFLKKEYAGKATDGYDRTANIRQEDNPHISFISHVRMLGLKGRMSEIAEYLIYEMDDNGYIIDDPEEFAEALSANVEEIKEALKIIKGMDPPGIGARDIQECLQLQLERSGRKKSLEYTIVSEFINELAKNDVDRVSKALNADKENVRNAISNIKKLNPRPASTILSKEAQTVMPDLIAEVKDKNINLMLNRDWLPQLGFHNPYEDEPDIAKDGGAKKFIKENMGAAKVLIDNLKRREETIYKVTDYILNFQISGLEKGKHEVKSLTIKDVASALNLHASTISRAISNKYVQINNEVMPLTAFLSKGVQKKDGEVISKANIKKKIETIINNEDKIHPLIDEEIRKKLETEGIRIERRTIAKYRNSLRILPAYLRKNFRAN